MKKIVKVYDYKQETNALRRAYFEVKSRENIIQFMINNNQQNTDFYKTFWSEYVDAVSDYEEAKYQFKLNCVDKIMEDDYTGQWYINFETKELTIG